MRRLNGPCLYDCLALLSVEVCIADMRNTGALALLGSGGCAGACLSHICLAPTSTLTLFIAVGRTFFLFPLPLLSLVLMGRVSILQRRSTRRALRLCQCGWKLLFSPYSSCLRFSPAESAPLPPGAARVSLCVAPHGYHLTCMSPCTFSFLHARMETGCRAACIATGLVSYSGIP